MTLSDIRATTRPAVLGLLTCLFAGTVAADGPVGDHVNHLQDHLDSYGEEVEWLIDQVDGLVAAYAEGGLDATRPEAVVDHWESVDFHAAIETNYVPLYASIWQGLYGVRQAMEKEAPLDEVRAQQTRLEQSLWQSLGAVKLAAQFQDKGQLAASTVTQASTPVATLGQIDAGLDRVLAKYAEQLDDEAITLIQDTYLNQFEGIEGVLIEQDADLVEDLEKDFNVTLPVAIQDGASVDQVRSVVVAMQSKLDRARALLEDAEAGRDSVF